ncbi:MAG: hypothetical protein JZU65_04995, partial [Chlorobium sp.]|nr:hypothetical protein [Chlorobium sp.]
MGAGLGVIVGALAQIWSNGRNRADSQKAAISPLVAFLERTSSEQSGRVVSSVYDLVRIQGIQELAVKQIKESTTNLTYSSRHIADVVDLVKKIAADTN